MTKLIDSVRYYIGDTDEDDLILSDEEIEFFLGETGDVPGKAAILAARACAAKFSKCADETVGKIQVKWSQAAKYYFKLADELVVQRKTMGLGTPKPFVGGASKSNVSSYTEDEDRVQDAFNIGSHDNTESGQS